MLHFKNVKSYEDLKTQYRKLALANHPDAGGDTAIMQDINKEYDQLFIIWKNRSKIEANETAASTRNEFYTSNGWEGENYNSKLSLKEIACIIREFINIHYNDCKFSVTTEYASMCQELHISIMESPHRAYKKFDELTDDDIEEMRRDYNYNNPNFYNETEKIFNERYTKRFYTEEIKEPMNAVNDYANSFNYDDTDAQIDYFDVNFYFFGVKVGKWDKPYKIVQRTKKDVPNVEHENVSVTKTRKYKTLEPQDIKAPAEFSEGQTFQLKVGFNYGCRCGLVYKITSISNGYINAYKLGKEYKNVCKGNIRGNNFCPSVEKLKQWVATGSISFIELIEVTKTEEYTSVVRRPKKQTGVSTEVNAEYKNTNETTQHKNFTVTPDIDTRDNSAIWVMKITDRLNREDYKMAAEAIKNIGGYYSKFKHGFIFNAEPETAEIERALSA